MLKNAKIIDPNFMLKNAKIIIDPILRRRYSSTGSLFHCSTTRNSHWPCFLVVFQTQDKKTGYMIQDRCQDVTNFDY